MTTHQIKLFAAYVRCGLDLHLTSKSLFISLDGLSSNLTRIRHQLCANLVIRGQRNKPAKLTPAGKCLYHYCDAILTALENIQTIPHRLNPIKPSS